MISCVQLVILVTAFVAACSDDDPNLGRTNDAGATSMAGSSDASIVGRGAGGGAGKPSSTGGRGQGATGGQGGAGGSGGIPNARGGAGGIGGTAVGGRAASGGITSAGGSTATGGNGGASGSMRDAALDGTDLKACHPDPHLACDVCVQTKCCLEWLDCANDGDCIGSAGGKDGELICIQKCLVLDETTTLGDCAGMCQHGVTVSTATSALIGCMQAGTADMQNCTMECFGRALL